MSLNGNNILGGASGQTTGYEIEQSLRFNNADGAYLSWTPSSTATSTKICTISCWVKRGQVDQERRIFAAAQAGSTPRTDFTFNSAGYLFIGLNPTGSAWYSANTSMLLRDPSAWYHIVWALDTSQATASNRSALYVNGEQVTDFSSNTLNDSTAVPQDSTILMGQSGMLQVVGAYANILGQSAYDGYMAEFHFVDGQKLTPASFGETNEDTNQWQAIEYDGSYGTNGFYLKFQNSSALGDDSSGNNNDFTPTNLAATDQVLDSPTNNFATLNPLATQTTPLSEGNLRKSTSDTKSNMSTIGVSSGKWYWEVYPETNNWGIGLVNDTETRQSASGSTTVAVLYSDVTSTGTPNSTETYDNFSSVSAGDIISIALDVDSETITFYQNNTRIFEADTFTIDGPFFPCIDRGTGATNNITINFGQDSSFAGSKTAQGNTDGNGIGDFYYTPPSGYLALCSDNLPDPSIADPTKHFNTVLYTGDGTTNHAITGVGFQPDLVWYKVRSTTGHNNLYDSVRGVQKVVYSDLTNAEATSTGTQDLYAFGADGFTVGSNFQTLCNTSGETFASWNWKAGGTASSNTDGTITSSVSANTTAGFSIATYTGNNTAEATIGHGLSQRPDLVIIKDRDNGSTQWVHNPIGALGSNYYGYFNTGSFTVDSSNVFWYTPTSSVVKVSAHSEVNASSTDYVMYCFNSVDGYSKVGSYTGNGSTDGTFVYTGFRPAFIMFKRTDSTSNWTMFDNKTDPQNSVGREIYADLSNAEGGHYDGLDFVSNGFKLRNTTAGFNASSGTFIYLAFAESPFKYSNAR